MLQLGRQAPESRELSVGDGLNDDVLALHTAVFRSHCRKTPALRREDGVA